jgi:GTP-binding protein
LLYLIDVSEWITEDPIVTVETLKNELHAYDPELLERPSAIVATKIDSQGQGQHLETLRGYCAAHHNTFFPISAITREGLPSLVTYLGKAVLEAKTSCASKC